MSPSARADRPIREIAVIGLGYIGLPTALLFATNGLRVVGVDLNRRLVRQVQEGKVPTRERGLPELLRLARRQRSFRAVRDLAPADAYLICISTPFDAAAGTIDLRPISGIGRQIGGHLKEGDLVILESTVPPGTTRGQLRPALEEASGLRAGEDFAVAHCPERVLPGNLLREMVENDRIVGGLDRSAGVAAQQLYARFVRGAIHVTDATTAEFVKLAENTYRNVNIGLANEFALVAQRLGVDVSEAIQLANRHPRVAIHQPGCGVGGYCIPKDPLYLTAAFPKETGLIQKAVAVNRGMPARTVRILEDGLAAKGRKLRGARVAVLGVSYKADVDDTRESPAREIVRILRSRGALIAVHDPFVKVFDVPVRSDLAAVLRRADAALVLADHRVYRELDWERYGRAFTQPPLIVDGRNALTVPRGFLYRGIGR